MGVRGRELGPLVPPPMRCRRAQFSRPLRRGPHAHPDSQTSHPRTDRDLLVLPGSSPRSAGTPPTPALVVPQTKTRWLGTKMRRTSEALDLRDVAPFAIAVRASSNSSRVRAEAQMAPCLPAIGEPDSNPPFPWEHQADRQDADPFRAASSAGMATPDMLRRLRQTITTARPASRSPLPRMSVAATDWPAPPLYPPLIPGRPSIHAATTRRPGPTALPPGSRPTGAFQPPWIWRFDRPSSLLGQIKRVRTNSRSSRDLRIGNPDRRQPGCRPEHPAATLPATARRLVRRSCGGHLIGPSGRFWWGASVALDPGILRVSWSTRQKPCPGGFIVATDHASAPGRSESAAERAVSPDAWLRVANRTPFFGGAQSYGHLQQHRLGVQITASYDNLTHMASPPVGWEGNAALPTHLSFPNSLLAARQLAFLATW